MSSFQHEKTRTFKGIKIVDHQTKTVLEGVYLADLLDKSYKTTAYARKGDIENR